MKTLIFPSNTLLLRKNRMPFSSGKTIMPILRVNSCYRVSSGCNKRHFTVNKNFIILPSAVEVIDEGLSERLIALWNKLNISETRFTDSSHFRADTQTPKVALDKSEWKSILFQYIVRYFPDFDLNNLPYAVYVCPICGSLHLGKTGNLHPAAGSESLPESGVSGDSRPEITN